MRRDRSSRPTRTSRPLAARRAFGPLQLLSLAAAVILGLVIALAKGRAAPAGPTSASASAPVFAAASSSSSSSPSSSPSASAASAGASGSASAAPSASGSSSPLDYAVVQDETDFDPKLSDEQKAALGTGKVPIHREGKYRSPFAHPRFGGPATAKVGLVLVSVREYSLQTGQFQADFFLSLTSDKPMPDLKLGFANGNEVNETVLADAPTFKAFRYRGTFVSRVDLRQYPFDRQELTLELEDQRAGVDQLLLDPNQERTSLDEGFGVTGWSVATLGARAYRHQYPPRFDRDDLYVSRYKFVLGIERFGTSAAFSVYVPALIIVIISLFGMWVPPEELEVRSNAGAPMLAAAVLFHYSLMQGLPATGYLTRADKIMMAVYVSLLMNMGSTWLFLVVEEAQVMRVFRIGRFSVPIATAVVMAVGMVL